MTSHAEKCPICRGEGQIQPEIQTYRTKPIEPTTCHGCGGTGWVTVHNDDFRMVNEGIT